MVSNTKNASSTLVVEEKSRERTQYVQTRKKVGLATFLKWELKDFTLNHPRVAAVARVTGYILFSIGLGWGGYKVVWGFFFE